MAFYQQHGPRFCKIICHPNVSICALAFSLLEKGQARKEGVGSDYIQFSHCPWGEKRCVLTWVESSCFTEF